MRTGCLCYATEQGVGYLAKSFYDHGVVTDPIVFMHDSRANHLEWYPSDTPTITGRPFRGPQLSEILKQLDAILIFETPFGDWQFLDYCRQHDVQTVIVPMYEWWPKNPPCKPDKVICPSLLDLDYFRKDFPSCRYIPIPVETKYWKQRTTARKFLHNAGGIGFREHKGTRELLKAMRHVKTPLRLTIRTQDAAGLHEIAQSIGGIPPNTYVEGARPYNELWDHHDVLIAPEKFNGLSLPLQEGRAAGMLVMTTDRYPANTWLPKEPLIPVQRRYQTQIAGHLNEIEECAVDPVDIARTMDEWYDRDISDYSLGGRDWAQQHSWHLLDQQWIKEILA